MSGYLRGLDTTGCVPIDVVVWAVIEAGDNYHHTDGWGDPAYDGGPSCIDKINAIAKRSAEIVVGIQAENARLRGVLRKIAHPDATVVGNFIATARDALAPAADTAEKPEAM